MQGHQKENGQKSTSSNSNTDEYSTPFSNKDEYSTSLKEDKRTMMMQNLQTQVHNSIHLKVDEQQ